MDDATFVSVGRLCILPLPVQQLDDGCVLLIRKEDGIIVDVDCRRIRIVPPHLPASRPCAIGAGSQLLNCEEEAG